MNKKRRSVPSDLAADLARQLSDMGCVYEWEGDNRSYRNSRYIFVRRPVAAKFRVADHPSDRIQKDLGRSRGRVYDVGPHAMSVEQAIEAFKQSLEVAAP